ncbi:MAG: hypothetical protein LKG27_06925 [Clostridiaceae bacterium]|jgi:hypothetical protein|nr:hypothetical protein [Clostridiaceae bacterium]
MQTSFLKFPPLKPAKYTSFFVYKSLGPKNAEYVAFSTKGKSLARMTAYPEMQLNHFTDLDSDLFHQSLYIDSLIVTQHGKKIGTKMLNIAEKESRLFGCGGNIHLVSSDCYFPSNPPHIFYRKNGFKSIDEKVNALIDKHIKHHTDFKLNELHYTYMTRFPQDKAKIIAMAKKNSEFGKNKSGIKYKFEKLIKKLFHNNVD